MGVRRHSSHKQQQKSSKAAAASPVKVAVPNGSSEDAAVVSEAGLTLEKAAPNARGGGGRHAQGLKPEPSEVLSAIQSLYVDQLKPFGRILRKRIAERAVAAAAAAVKDGETVTGAAAVAVTAVGTGENEVLPDVDIKHLRAVCESCELLFVEPEEGGDWSAVFRGPSQPFVNVYSPLDNYPTSLWNAAAAYFAGLGEDEMNLPGGRYSCAQALVKRKLHFLSNCSLGQVCHIVQLAISQKKILGYSNGAVVPYHRSQSMVKECCAQWQRPCATTDGQNTVMTQAMPLATWEMARACLREILENAAVPGEGPAVLPLSNVKRLFRSKYHLELSETKLGHSKLSELLQDEHFSDVCTVQLQAHGYIVVQRQGPPNGGVISLANSLPPFENAIFDPMQECGTHEPRRLEFCPGTPLRLEDAGLCMEGCLPATPLASPGVPSQAIASSWPAYASLPYTLSNERDIGSIVQNTFIHAAAPPPTPPPGAKRRALSMPKDAGSAKSPSASYQNLSVMSKPVEGCSMVSTVDCSASVTESSGSAALPWSPAPSSVQDRTGELSSPMPDAAPMKVQLSLYDYEPPQSQLLQPGLESGDACTLADDNGGMRPQRLQFCPDEPLSLEDAGLFVEGAQLRPFPTPPGLVPQVPTEPRWPALSPSVLSKEGAVGSMVQNTFIHAALPPPTPAPGTVRRSRSLPKDVGSHKVAWEATCHALSFLPRPLELGGTMPGEGDNTGTPNRGRGGRGNSDLVARNAISNSTFLASPGPAFVPPSPALTASPLYFSNTSSGVYFSRAANFAPLTTKPNVLLLTDLL